MTKNQKAKQRKRNAALRKGTASEAQEGGAAAVEEEPNLSRIGQLSSSDDLYARALIPYKSRALIPYQPPPTSLLQRFFGGHTRSRTLQAIRTFDKSNIPTQIVTESDRNLFHLRRVTPALTQAINEFDRNSLRHSLLNIDEELLLLAGPFPVTEQLFPGTGLFSVIVKPIRKERQLAWARLIKAAPFF